MARRTRRTCGARRDRSSWRRTASKWMWHPGRCAEVRDIAGSAAATILWCCAREATSMSSSASWSKSSRQSAV
eukprot:306713-Pyramimonas_sp.AAC.1